MPTPVVTNDDGTFRYCPEARRWICVSGKIPGGGAGSHANCYVYLMYGSELTRQAHDQGFTGDDFGYSKPEEQEKLDKKKSSVKKRKRTKKNDDVLFDFSD